MMIKKWLSIIFIVFLVVGCSSNNQPNNNNNDNEQGLGGVDTPNGNDADQEDPQELIDHNEIAPKIDLEIILLKRNEILLEVNNIGEDDFSTLRVYLTLFEEDSNEAIEREYTFTAFSAGNVSYQFSTDLIDYTLALDRTIVRYGYGSPYAKKYGDLSQFVTIQHSKSDTNSVVASAKNEGDQLIEFLSLYTIYYADNEVIGAHMRFASDIEPNAEVSFDFYSPIDVDNYILSYDDYVVGVRAAYYTKP
jgi:hypothetical protein